MESSLRLCLSSLSGAWRKKVALLVALMLCGHVVTMAQTENADSISVDGCRFRPQQLIVPAFLITTGSFGVSNGWFRQTKQHVRKDFGRLRGDCRFVADDYLQYAPLVAGVGLGLTGIKACHPLRERVSVAITSSAAMALMVNVTKYTVGEKRPDSSARNSFPSGHTATAFMGAEMVREEYGIANGIGAYAFATGIAMLRLYNDRHWLNDVIGGAGFGILATRMGYWLLPYERKLFKWDKRGVDAVIVPACNTTEGHVGLSFSAQF